MLATQKHITLRALSVVLAISLCCIPLFGFSNPDSPDPLSKDAVFGDDERFVVDPTEFNLSDKQLEALEEMGFLSNGLLLFLGDWVMLPNPPITYEYMANEYWSLRAIEKLVQAGIVDVRFSTVGEHFSHPAYGGLHLDDKGILVISLVDDNARLKEEIASILGDTAYYTRSVTYSWDYLCEVCGVIGSYMTNMSIAMKVGEDEGPVFWNFTLCGVDELLNNVFVYLQDPSEEAIASFKENVIDSPVLVFGQYDRIMLHVEHVSEF